MDENDHNDVLIEQNDSDVMSFTTSAAKNAVELVLP